MKWMRLVAVLTALAPLAPASAQDFEGVVRQRVLSVGPAGVARLSEGGTPDPAKLLEVPLAAVAALDSGVTVQEVSITVKGDRMRIDGIGAPRGPMAGAYTLLDAGAGVAMMVMPGTKRIMVLTAEDAAAMAARMAAMTGAPPGEPQVADLGGRTVNGFAVHGVRVTQGTTVAEAWVAPELKPHFARFAEVNGRMRAMSPTGSAAILKAAEGRGYPILVRTVARRPAFMGGEGLIYTITEVTGVERKPVADDVFALPADYTQGSMAQMMGGGGRPPR